MGGKGYKVEGRFKREGTYVHLWLTHVDVEQKASQYCKAITCQLKMNTFFKVLKKHYVFMTQTKRCCAKTFLKNVEELNILKYAIHY